MVFNRFPVRDPRTAARDIPGVLDTLFPRLSGGLVASLNKQIFSFPDLEAISEEMIANSNIQNAMLFEISTARAEFLLKGENEKNWDDCLQIAVGRQKRHFDAEIPNHLLESDIIIAAQAASNLEKMLKIVKIQYPEMSLEYSPPIPGLGWVATGVGDFAIGSMLIEVKHTDRNFRSGDFRQVLMYCLLKYVWSIEQNTTWWDKILLLNPRKNFALKIDFSYLSRAASGLSSQIELAELLRYVVNQELERR